MTTARAGKTTLRIVTYNIHRCRGLDGRTQPERVARLLRELQPDIVAMQEVLGPGHHGESHLELLSRRLDMPWVMAPTRQYRGQDFGNAVLTRFPVVGYTQHDLSYRRREPRSCQRVDVQVGGRRFRVFNVHLGTSPLERRNQAPRLAAFIEASGPTTPQIVLGDFNEWIRGATTASLGRMFRSVDVRIHIKRRWTYPGVLPVLHLDHIYYDGSLEIAKVVLPRSRLALVASDHLPLVADVELLPQS